jgi:ABC-type branched-subunit amino acid transport system ATPase component
MHFVRNLCNHVVVLNFGEKIFEGTPDEVHQNPAVLEAYLGSEDTQPEKETSDAS